jgi:hypothetical protein
LENEGYQVYNNWEKNGYFTLKEYETFIEGGMNEFLGTIEEFHLKTYLSAEISEQYIDYCKKNLKKLKFTLNKFSEEELNDPDPLSLFNDDKISFITQDGDITNGDVQNLYNHLKEIKKRLSDGEGDGSPTPIVK